MGDDIWERVIADMQARRAVGLERYGKPVRAADPEDWGQHLAEELLDALVYLKALRLRLTWTTDLPTVPGCYWRRSLRHPEETDCLRVFDHAGTEVDRWNFEAGWPSKWSASDLDASTDDVMIEELTIVHEWLERKA